MPLNTYSHTHCSLYWIIDLCEQKSSMVLLQWAALVNRNETKVSSRMPGPLPTGSFSAEAYMKHCEKQSNEDGESHQWDILIFWALRTKTQLTSLDYPEPKPLKKKQFKLLQKYMKINKQKKKRIKNQVVDISIYPVWGLLEPVLNKIIQICSVLDSGCAEPVETDWSIVCYDHLGSIFACMSQESGESASGCCTAICLLDPCVSQLLKTSQEEICDWIQIVVGSSLKNGGGSSWF